jgi:hypothetical protein
VVGIEVGQGVPPTALLAREEQDGLSSMRSGQCYALGAPGSVCGHRGTNRHESVTITPDWMPTGDTINALAAPLQTFIHQILSECAPAGTMRENVIVRDENEALRRKIAELGLRRDGYY